MSQLVISAQEVEFHKQDFVQYTSKRDKMQISAKVFIVVSLALSVIKFPYELILLHFICARIKYHVDNERSENLPLKLLGVILGHLTLIRAGMHLAKMI